MEEIYENKEAILLQQSRAAGKDRRHSLELTGGKEPKDFESNFNPPIVNNNGGLVRNSLEDKEKVEQEIATEDDVYREMYLSVGCIEATEDLTDPADVSRGDVYDDISNMESMDILSLPVPTSMSTTPKARGSLQPLGDFLRPSLTSDELFKNIQRQPILSLTSDHSIATYRKIYEAQQKARFPPWLAAMIVFNFILNVFIILGVTLHVLGILTQDSSCPCAKVKTQLADMSSHLSLLNQNQSDITLRTARLESQLLQNHCPNGWFYFNESCFFMHAAENGNYAQAKKGCEKLGADVTSIYSQAENEFIVSRFLSCPWAYAPTAYIALSYVQPSKETGSVSPYDGFRWEKNVMLTYANFQNISTSTIPGSCFLVQRDGFWYPEPCNKALKYICRSPTGNTC